MTLKARRVFWARTVRSRQRDVERRSMQEAHAHQKYLKRTPANSVALIRSLNGAERRLKTSKESLRKAQDSLAKVEHQLIPMRQRALNISKTLVGIVEKGGNNVGPMVTKIIHENGGTAPEPWCGDFVAYCYRRAGSKMVTRGWASVRILGWLTGMKVVHHPVPGAIVIFNFGTGADHTGLVEKVINPSTIQTIEGNTGSVGAVSDSNAGHDGVKRKRRSSSLVARYVIPTR